MTVRFGAEAYPAGHTQETLRRNVNVRGSKSSVRSSCKLAHVFCRLYEYPVYRKNYLFSGTLAEPGC